MIVRRPISTLLGLCIGLALMGADSAPALSGPATSGTMIFRDDDGAMVLAVDLDPTSAESGRLSVRVPGVGTFLPVTRATVTRDRNDVEVEYAGELDVISPAGERTRVTGEVTATFKLDKGKATARLSSGRETYKLKARGVPSVEVVDVLPAFEQSLRQGNWTAIHAMLASDLRTRDSAAAFETALIAQTAVLGPIEALRRISVGTAAPSALGLSYVVVTYEVDRRTTAGRRTTAYDAYFIFEDPSWRLWYTAPR